jgi:hypothetical protein
MQVRTINRHTNRTTEPKHAVLNLTAGILERGDIDLNGQQEGPTASPTRKWATRVASSLSYEFRFVSALFDAKVERRNGKSAEKRIDETHGLVAPRPSEQSSFRKRG